MFKFSPFLYIFVISANIKWMETKNWIPGNKNDNVIQLIQLMALRIVHRNTLDMSLFQRIQVHSQFHCLRPHYLTSKTIERIICLCHWVLAFLELRKTHNHKVPLNMFSAPVWIEYICMTRGRVYVINIVLVSWSLGLG